MPTSRPVLRPALALALAALAAAILVLPTGARAARHDALPLHVGSSGPRVIALQWLLGGHRPNVFTQVKGTFKGSPTGYFGPKTAAAVEAYKFRLGYPKQYVRPVAGPLFFGLLRGTAHRPARWVAIAASRVRAVNTGPTALAERMRALEVSWLGIHEEPDGSNRGPRISYSVTVRGPPARFYPSIQSSTGAYGLAWCVSTVQEALKEIGYGTFADNTAGVYAAVDWAAARSLLSAKPKVGAIVAFIDYDSHGRRIPGTGHMGYVVAVQANSFTYIAGNDGNAVREHTIPDGSRAYAFIYLPRLAS